MNHPDEYQALIGATKDDMSYVERVQSTYYECEAGKHVARMLSALLVGKPDVVPARDLELLLGEYFYLAAGGRLPRESRRHADGCNCVAGLANVRDLRCVGGDR